MQKIKGQLTITLPDELAQMIRAEVMTSPLYSTISEYIRDAIREKRARDAKT
jgi:Arc/MetJ-type ribon-helix-helix transcriptional regulator